MLFWKSLPSTPTASQTRVTDAADEKNGEVGRAQSTTHLLRRLSQAKRIENEGRHAGESLIYFALEFALVSRGK